MSDDTVARPPSTRTSDAEREQVIRTLQREFAAGRVTMAELEQRIDAAQAARTREELWTLAADLPAELVAAPTVRAPSHCWMCLLWCLCPPAGLMYLLLSRLEIRGEP